MRELTKLILKTYIPVFLIALLFFVLIIELVDLFSNLVRYLNLDVPLQEIARVQILYLPKSISFALPIAVLFAASFTLGTLHSNNELIAVFAAGIPLHRFVFPIILSGILLSAGWFVFQEEVVIETYEAKNELSQDLLNMNRDRNNRDVTALSTSGNAIYHAKYYNSDTKTLSDLVVLQRDGDGRFLRRIDARWARWNGETWVLHDAHIFEKPEGADAGAGEDADGGGDAGGRTGGDASEPSGPRSELTHRFAEEVRYETLRTAPEIFGRTQWDVEEMQLAEARTRVEALKEAGLPYREALTDYHRRIAFSLTPLVVTLLSTAIGGRFKKNILLMSLLVSLSLSVVYYVIGMIAQLMAASGTLRPFVAAWLAVVLFSFTGIVLLRHART